MEFNIGEWLSKRAFLTPDHVAYIDNHRTPRMTFRELDSLCNQTASAFIEAGVQKGDRVGLLLMNSSEFMQTFFALAKIGAVVVPLNWRLVANELEFILKDSGAQSLVFSDEFAGVVEDLYERGDKTDIKSWYQVVEDAEPLPIAKNFHEFISQGSEAEQLTECGDDDMLYIMYTSGTTGLPKGVVHTHRTCAWGAMTIAATTHYLEDDVFISPLPMFHVGALTPLTVNVYRGVTSVVMRTFDPLEAWQLIEKHKVTISLFVPAMMSFMLQVGDLRRFDISQYRWCMTGAAPVPNSLITAFVELGIDVRQVYGLTESCGPACLIDGTNSISHIGSTGKSFFHTEVKIVRSDGSACDPDEAGEVLVKGQHVMKEYWNRPDATVETLVDGWLHTGDVATMDKDGFVYIQDRIKDMIISGGENVYPAEIENVIQDMDGVVECGVIGQESERWGESPFAVVVRASDTVTEADVLNFCNGKLARFKMPVAVAFVDALPRNPSGKILKRLLREQFPGPAQV